MKKVFGSRNDSKYLCNYSLPPTKLRNVFCTHCKHQFFLREFVPLRGVVPLLLECGHVICEKCAKTYLNKPCPLCNMTPQFEDDQKVSLPLNMYALGLMVVSHNRPVGTDDSDISFSKPANSKLKQQGTRGLCHECGIQAAIKCPQCNALYCFVCYSKIHGRALQNHSKIVLSEGNDGSLFIVRNTCSERCNEPLGYYCEHCEIAGCSHCMLRLHKKHNYLPLSSKNKQLLPEFHQVQGRVTENLKRVRQAGKKLKTTALYPTRTQNADNVEAAVTQHFAYLHGVLQNVERKIIETLQQQRDSRSKNIDEISEQLKELEDRLHSSLVVTASIEENLDKVDLQQVVQKLGELADIPCHLIVNSVRNDQEIRFNVDESIVEAMEKHCSVQIPAVSSFSLQRAESLPDDYEMEPLTEEINIPKFNANSSMRMKSESTESLHSRKNDNPPAVGSSEMVRVTHVVDPSCFYVQLMQNQNRLADLSKGLSVMANTWGITPTDVTLNALYVVQSAKDRLWYRGRVVNRKTDAKGDAKYGVLFVDYGMKEAYVPISRMRNIVPQFAMMPILAIRCTLFDVVPNDGMWHPDATQAFKKLVCTNAMVSMCIMMITGDTYYVELCVISSQDSGLISVKDSLTYMKYATCVSPNKLMRLNPDSTRQYFKEQLELECYTDVQVLFVESPSAIYVQKKHANRSYFCTMVREMTEHYEQNMSSSDLIPVPCKGLPCAARGVDGYWHRGLVREVTENTVKVFYVDLGYTLILSYDGIRSLSRRYMGCRTQAIKISLRNIKATDNKTWGDATNEFLKKLLMTSKNFKIVAFEKLGETYSVAMYTLDKTSVIHLLVKNNLALHTGSGFYNKDVNAKRQRKNRSKKNFVTAVPPQEPYDAPEISVVNKSVTKKSASEDSEDPFKVCIMIHHAESPDSIYVSDATCEQHDNIDQMLAQMQEFYSKYRSAKREVWSKDTVCAVFLSRNDMYYRGRIIDIKSPDKVLVFLYDLGLEEIVTLNDIQSLYPPFFKVPTYVFKIKLTGILPCGGSMSWPSLSCEELRGIVNNNHYCKFYISKLEDEDVEDSAIPVELWIKQSKMDGPLTPTRIEINSINRMLVEKGVALPIKEYARKRDKILAIELKRQMIKKLERLSKCEINVKWHKIDDELNESVESIDKEEASKTFLRYSDSESGSEDYSSEEIFDNIPSLPKLSAWLPADPIVKDSFVALPTYLDHNGYLYLHSKEQSGATLRKIETKLEKLYKNCTIESCDTVWAAGDMCIAQYHANEKWYRGKVVKVQENELFDVEFVDYGNVEECTIGNLKKKVVLENIPMQCTKCLIYHLIPGNERGQWMIEDLDKIHSLLIEQECMITILDRTKEYLIVSVTLLETNRHCKKKTDLITFLTNEWGMNINLNMNDSIVSENSSATDNADVITQNSRLFCSDDEIEKGRILGGSPVVFQHLDPDEIRMKSLNTNESCATTDLENLSWVKAKSGIITSTPYVVSEENLLINYKMVDIPGDIEFVEIELCCSISAFEFYAQLKENEHSTVLHSYYKQYRLLMNELQTEAYKQPVITNLTPHTPCCAQFTDGLWYRCLIIDTESINGTDHIEVKLLFVDYGNDEYRTVNPELHQLHNLKKEWMQLPAMAIKCKLWNVEVVSVTNRSALLSQLESMYNKRVIATIKDADENFMYVELYGDETRKELMYSALIEEGLFQFKASMNE